MLKVIKGLAQEVINKIDAGNSNITESEAIEVATFLNKVLNKEETFNRTTAAKYLHCSIQSFNLYRKLNKLPEGTKELGGCIRWTKSQLDDFIKKYKS